MAEKILNLIKSPDFIWVSAVVVLIALALRFKKSSWVSKILKPLIINAENTHLKGEGKLMKVIKDFRELTPSWVKLLITDDFLKHRIEEVLSLLQDSFKLEKEKLTKAEIDSYIKKYEELLNEVPDEHSKEIIRKRIEELKQ